MHTNWPLEWNNVGSARMGHCTLDTDIQTSKSVSRLPEGMSGVAECFRSLKVSTCLRLHNTPILSLLPPSKLLSFLNFTFCKELNSPEIGNTFSPLWRTPLSSPVRMGADLCVGDTWVWHQGHVGVEEHGTCPRPGHVTHPIGLEDAIHVLHVTITHPVLAKTLPEVTHYVHKWRLWSFTHSSPDKSSNVLDEVCRLWLLFPLLPVRLEPLHSGLVKVGLRPFDIQEPQNRNDAVGLEMGDRFTWTYKSSGINLKTGFDSILIEHLTFCLNIWRDSLNTTEQEHVHCM